MRRNLHHHLGALLAAGIAASVLWGCDNPEVSQGYSLPEMSPLKLDTALQEVVLPSSFFELEVGGGGRYLILHYLTDRKFAVFDVSAGKIKGFIPVTEGDEELLFTAGADALIVYFKEGRTLQRWSLESLELELSQKLDKPENPQWMGLGSASQGPLFFLGGYKEKNAYYNPKTFQKLRISGAPGRTYPASSHARISASGQMVCTYPSVNGSVGFVRNGMESRKWTTSPQGVRFPNAGGTHFFSRGGIYDLHSKKREPISGRGADVIPIPAVHGNYYFTIPWKTFDLRPDQEIPPIGVHILGRPEPLFFTPNIPEAAYKDFSDKGKVDKRFLLIPDAQVLIFVNKRRDRLFIQQLEIDSELKKSGEDYLFIESCPQVFIGVGDTWTYRPVVKSKRGGVSLSLKSCPSGMEVVGDTLTWIVPEGAAILQNEVVVSAKDASGEEFLHSFIIDVSRNPVSLPNLRGRRNGGLTWFRLLVSVWTGRAA